jgi:hypothetical protein
MLSQMHADAHIKYPLLLADFNETSIFSPVFEKSLDVKFHEDPSSRSQVVPSERKDRRAEA